MHTLYIESPEHEEGAAGFEPSWEDAIEGGGGAGHLGKVLSRIDTGVVIVWGKGLSVVDANGA